MVKFTIGTIVPENSGWVWSSEEISEPNPRYIHVKLACASGVVDMSRVAAGKVLYDARQIKVTFARFVHGVDYWKSGVQSLTNQITQALNINKTLNITTKTNPDMQYVAYSFRYSVSRDGIIQFLTMTFDVKPVNLHVYSETVNAGYDTVEFLQSEADDATLQIVCKGITCVDNNGDPAPNANISIYDEDYALIATRTSAGWAANPLVVDLSSDSSLQYTVSADVAGWEVTLSWTKEEI